MHYSAPQAEASTSEIHCIQTLSNFGKHTVQFNTVIQRPIIQQGTSAVSLEQPALDSGVHLTCDLEVEPLPPQKPKHEPGGIVVKVKPKAKRYQNSVSLLIFS